MRTSLLRVFTKLFPFQTSAFIKTPPAFPRSSLLASFDLRSRCLTTALSSSKGNSNSNGMTEVTTAPKKTQQRRRNNHTSSYKAPIKHAGASGEGGPRPKRPKNNNTTSTTICRDFLQSGTCNYGDKCRFLHTTAGEEERQEAMDEGMTPMNVEDSMSNPSTTTSAGQGQVAHVTEMKFADLDISAESKKSMSQVFKYELMTQVQAETLPIILQGIDCLAKAKTGTGKTLGFLIPAVEQIIKSRGQLRSEDIGCLILSPTRELAFQIHKEAEALTKFHNINTMSCVGGTNISKDNNALKNSVQILVATPGRLLDHLQNGGLAKRLVNMKVLIMDEADQLLDMGFRPDIERILKLLQPSKSKRQTLLFSATVPGSVSEIANIALKPNYSFIDTVGQEVEQTHLHVKQELVVTPQAQQVHAIEAILSKETPSNQPFKVIVFFTTARLTGFMADLFNSVKSDLGYSTLEIHSRMSQPARQKASDAFRSSSRAVLFSSDVSARGMDYPDVTFVLQVGLTERSQYIHRLGRTARAGKEGKGCLLLTDYEEKWMCSQLKDMPLEKVPVPTVTTMAGSGKQGPCMDLALTKVSRDKELNLSAQQAYRAWLGFYNSNTKKFKWDKTDLVHAANQWAKDVGLREQPTIERKTLGKMGLMGVRGLNLE